MLGGDDLGQLVLAAFSSSRKANSTCVRRASEVSRQAGNAAAAEAITASASTAEASATRPVTSPLAGLVTSAARSQAPAHRVPSSQCPIVDDGSGAGGGSMLMGGLLSRREGVAAATP